jgi:hypothetical protein
LAHQSSFVAPAWLWLAIRSARLVLVVIAASAFKVGSTLACHEPNTCSGDGVEPVLATRDLGFVPLGLVGRTRFVELCVDLGFHLGFGLGHMTVAHGLVATGVGLELGAVDRDRTKLDQTHLARQAHDLDEKVAQLLEVRRAEVAHRTVGRDIAYGQHPKRYVS